MAKPKNTFNRDARFFIDAVRDRGGHLPDLIAAFPECGIMLDRTAVVDLPCPACSSVLVSKTDELGRDRDPMFYHLPPSGSSLRLHNSDAHLQSGNPDGLPRCTAWTLQCGSGGSCSYVMTASEFLDLALGAVGPEEFVRRARPIQGGWFPTEAAWFALYLAHNPKKGVFMSPGTPQRALDKLAPGCGVRVLLQEVRGISEKDATSHIDPRAWEDCITSEAGELLRPADIIARAAAAKAAEEEAKREAEIATKLAEFETELRKKTSA
jgi:hypothetical protein